MVIHEISDLIEMAKGFKEEAIKKYVIEQNTPIFVFGSNINSLYYTGYDREVVMKM